MPILVSALASLILIEQASLVLTVPVTREGVILFTPARIGGKVGKKFAIAADIASTYAMARVLDLPPSSSTRLQTHSVGIGPIEFGKYLVGIASEEEDVKDLDGWIGADVLVDHAVGYDENGEKLGFFKGSPTPAVIEKWLREDESGLSEGAKIETLTLRKEANGTQTFIIEINGKPIRSLFSTFQRSQFSESAVPEKQFYGTLEVGVKSYISDRPYWASLGMVGPLKLGSGPEIWVPSLRVGPEIFEGFSGVSRGMLGPYELLSPRIVVNNRNQSLSFLVLNDEALHSLLLSRVAGIPLRVSAGSLIVRAEKNGLGAEKNSGLVGEDISMIGKVRAVELTFAFEQKGIKFAQVLSRIRMQRQEPMIIVAGGKKIVIPASVR